MKCAAIGPMEEAMRRPGCGGRLASSDFSKAALPIPMALEV